MRPIEILMVEDNPGDIRLTKEFLKESKNVNRMYEVPDGEEAMLYLRKQGKYVNAVMPDVIILDLNLPKKDGREVLREIKTDQDLKRIPVIIFTSSPLEEDILKAYDNHANCYIRKPVILEHYIKALQKIEDFWCTVVKLPLKAM